MATVTWHAPSKQYVKVTALNSTEGGREQSVTQNATDVRVSSGKR